MTLSSAQAVLDRMEAEEAFAERVMDAGGPEASLTLLGADGFQVTQQELRDAVLDRYGDALTPEQLDAIAGGTEISDRDAAVLGGTAAVGGAALGGLAAAAAAV